MIAPDYFLLVVGLLTFGTILIRGLFIAVSHKINISAQLKELFSFIPAAIFPALVVPATFFHQGQVPWLAGKERFVVLLAASLLAYLVRNTLAVISFGLATLYLATHGWIN